MGRLLLLSMFFVASSIQAQGCPTIEATQQSFCDYQYVDALGKSVQPTINYLQVTDNGGGVVWYSQSTGGTALSNEELLVDGATYYADNSGGTCQERPSVTVKVDTYVSAGKGTQLYLCPAELGSFYIWELIDPVSAERPTYEGGTAWVGSVQIPNLINLEEIESGTVITYKVPPSEYGICDDGDADSAKLTIFIGDPANAGEGGDFTFLSNEEPKEFITLLGETAETGGTWNPAIPENGEFDPSNSGAGSFMYTYTVKKNTIVGNNATNQRTITCEDSATVQITVIEVSEDGKVMLCHNGKPLKVNEDAVPAHRAHGDDFGDCGSGTASKTVVSPNPSRGEFNFSNELTGINKIRILNFQGGLETEFTNSGDPNLLEVNLGQLRKGIYFAEVITSNGKEVLRLIKK